MRRALALLAATWLCTACFGSVFKSDIEPPDRYRLAGPVAAAGGEALPLAISVARPGAASSLDTERIAVVKPDHGFDYLAGARWADPAPQMLQQLLVAALAVDGRFATAVAAPSHVPTDLLLDVELGHFEAVYASVDTPPRIRVELHANLVDVRKGVRVASFEAGAEASAARNDQRAVVAAFEQATDEAVQTVAQRVRAAVAAAKP